MDVTTRSAHLILTELAAAWSDKSPTERAAIVRRGLMRHTGPCWNTNPFQVGGTYQCVDVPIAGDKRVLIFCTFHDSPEPLTDCIQRGWIPDLKTLEALDAAIAAHPVIVVIACYDKYSFHTEDYTKRIVLCAARNPRVAFFRVDLDSSADLEKRLGITSSSFIRLERGVVTHRVNEYERDGDKAMRGEEYLSQFETMVHIM